MLAPATALAQTGEPAPALPPAAAEPIDAAAKARAAGPTPESTSTAQPEVTPGAAASGDDVDAAAAKEAALPSREEMAAQLRTLSEQVAELKAAQVADSEAALLTDPSAEQDESPDRDTFRLYGFMDMGIQRMWANEEAAVGAVFNPNALTFAVGNIDMYFDFTPDPDWRALAEIRFTGAPHGNVTSFGQLGGGFERQSTQQYDPHAATPNAQLWGGYAVIERAWIEWSHYQHFQVRVGSFFTPFGIWNVDHGSPTLISTFMPQFMQQLFFPVRQTGVQALGSAFVGDWEVAYRAWVTNGRQELANLDFTDDKALGARVFITKESGSGSIMAGMSYHHGRVADRVVNLVSAPPISDELVIGTEETFAYVENVAGLDLSVDVGRTRIRTEGAAQVRRYEEGKRPPAGFLTPASVLTPDSVRFSAYALVAHQLPFWGLEPYLYGEVLQQTWEFPDGFVVLAPGLNIRFTPAAQLKLQASRAVFFNWMQDYEGDLSRNNVTNVAARIVLAY
jgi:hypothetical protein